MTEVAVEYGNEMLIWHQHSENNQNAPYSASADDYNPWNQYDMSDFNLDMDMNEDILEIYRIQELLGPDVEASEQSDQLINQDPWTFGDHEQSSNTESYFVNPQSDGVSVESASSKSIDSDSTFKSDYDSSSTYHTIKSKKRTRDEYATIRNESHYPSLTLDELSVEKLIGESQTFPRELCDAFNEGNMKKLFLLADKYLSDDFIAYLSCNTKKQQRSDRYFIPKFYTALLNTHPDGVLCLRRMQTSVGDGFYKIKCNFRFRGTRMHSHYFDELIGDKWDRITDFFDPKRITVAEKEKWMKLEDEMIEKGKIPVMFVKVELNLYVDKHSKLITKYEAQARLSSFQIADLDI